MFFVFGIYKCENLHAVFVSITSSTCFYRGIYLTMMLVLHPGTRFVLLQLCTDGLFCI